MPALTFFHSLRMFMSLIWFLSLSPTAVTPSTTKGGRPDYGHPPAHSRNPGLEAGLGQDDTSEPTPLRPVEQHPGVARRLPAPHEGRKLERLDLGRRAVVGEPTGVLPDEPEFVAREHEVAREVLEVADLDDGVALVLADDAGVEDLLLDVVPEVEANVGERAHADAGADDRDGS